MTAPDIGMQLAGHVPSASQMLADIEVIVGFGIRRPGYEADRQAESWAVERFANLGLRDVAAEPVELQRLGLTGEPEPRWWFTSPEPGLEAAVADALRSEQLSRSFVLPPTVFGDAPTTDGSAIYLAGVPIVQYLTAPMYLFDAEDTIDKIHVPSLEPVTRAVIRIIESVRGRSAAELRAAGRPRPGH